MDVCLEFGGPFGEGDEWEVELIAEGAEEGEGGDGEGMGDVEICRLRVAHLGHGLGCGVNWYPMYDLGNE